MGIDTLIQRAGSFYGDILLEYAEANGATHEQLSSGEWEPTPQIIKHAMSDAIEMVAKDDEDIDYIKTVNQWYKNY